MLDHFGTKTPPFQSICFHVLWSGSTISTESYMAKNRAPKDWSDWYHLQVPWVMFWVSPNFCKACGTPWYMAAFPPWNHRGFSRSFLLRFWWRKGKFHSPDQPLEPTLRIRWIRPEAAWHLDHLDHLGGYVLGCPWYLVSGVWPQYT